MTGKEFSKAFQELGIYQRYIAAKTGIKPTLLAQLFIGLRRMQPEHSNKLENLLERLKAL